MNVRIIAATNQPLEQMVRENRFRSDLFFRLRMIQLDVPTLRDRGKDVLSLANHYLRLHSARYGKKNLRFSPETEKQLAAYSWPGNVRELRNVIEQTVLMAREEVIAPTQLAFCPSLATPGVQRESCAGACFTIPEIGINLEQLEKELVMHALDKAGGNVTQAAKFLGLTRDTLRYRVEKYRITTS